MRRLYNGLIFVIIACSGGTISADESNWCWRYAGDSTKVCREKSELDSLLQDAARRWTDYGLPAEAYGTSVTLDLTGAKLSRSDLSHKALRGVVLCGANLDSANLTGADLTNTIFDRDYGITQVCEAKTTLEFADLSGCIFEPIGLPSVKSLSTARGLKNLDYRSSPASLVQLAEEFRKQGFRQQERDVICALRRHDPSTLDKLLLFDPLCEYGSNLSKPLWLVFWFWLVAAVVYYTSFFTRDQLGIRLIEPSRNRNKNNWAWTYDDKKENIVFDLNCRNGDLSVGWPNPRLARLPVWFRLLWWALFFSAISAFNIGFRDVNFGRWLRLLTRRDFDLQPYGWVRVVSGFQALISVYLVALWILSFAGTPFK